MDGEIKELVKNMKSTLPGCIGVAIFSVNEDLILEADIDVPDYDPDYAAAVHSEIWLKIKHFINILPQPLRSEKIKSIALEMKSAYLQLTVLKDEEFLIMTGIHNDNNLGVLRFILKKYKERFEKVL